MSVRDDLSAGINVIIHFTFLGAIAWATGRPFLFPSLGPSAYLLATGEQPRAEGAYHVIGGHAIAAVFGLLAYVVFADGLLVTDAFTRAESFSPAVGRLAVSSTVAMVLTTVGMLWSDTNHAAACATTLIVALGLMSTPLDTGIIVASVVLLVGFHGKVVEPLQDHYGVEPRDAR
ncbi:HPP family protein [Natronosalvus halobius]|uniref:HPP family protein n=1 Tax=Natronosalvus halobius TaxID=2953746 RepID=UPI00209F8531|nr:HPP family protein [Natronosalvus halobius]USZ72734.1 HPP family protein [Natronosalvus halobius]